MSLRGSKEPWQSESERDGIPERSKEMRIDRFPCELTQIVLFPHKKMRIIRFPRWEKQVIPFPRASLRNPVSGT